MPAFARAARASVLNAGLGWPNPGWAPLAGSFGQSITDILINSDTAMTVGAFHAGVRLIAEDIGSLPLHLFEKVGKARNEAPDSQLYEMLAAAPNPEMTAMVWRETMIGHLLTWGNLYSEKELNGNGVTVRLWPLRPDRMSVEREQGSDRRIYKYRMPNGSGIVLPANRVFHVPGFGFDGLVGYSRIKAAHRTLENAIAVEEYGLRTFATGAQPGVTIKHKNQLSKDAKRNIVDSWDEMHQGLSNTQRTAILDEGMELDQIGFPPQDAQFLESKQHSVEDVARWLRLAPPKLSDYSRASFSNIEESNIDYVVGTLTPHLVRLEQQYKKDLFAGTRLYAKHAAGALMRGNAKDRAEFYQIMRQNGLYTDDEIRGFEDLNPLSAEDRQHVLWPLNSVPASAYDANGMTFASRIDAAGVLVRAGFDPAAALAALQLPAVEHTGLVPVTVTLDPQTASKNGQGAPAR